MGNGKVETVLSNDGKTRLKGNVGSQSTLVTQAKAPTTDINNIVIKPNNRQDGNGNIESGESDSTSKQQGRYESAEFYVDNPGLQTISETANYEICRNGEMKLLDTRNGNTYFCTGDLLRAGIDSEEKLYELINNDTLSIINNPWFEVWGKTSDYFSDPLNSLKEAEEEAEFLEAELAKEQATN